MHVPDRQQSSQIKTPTMDQECKFSAFPFSRNKDKIIMYSRTEAHYLKGREKNKTWYLARELTTVTEV